MDIQKELIDEFERETESTRKLLNAIPPEALRKALSPASARRARTPGAIIRWSVSAAGAALAAAAVAGLAALACDFALLLRVHRGESALGTAASVRCHVFSPVTRVTHRKTLLNCSGSYC